MWSETVAERRLTAQLISPERPLSICGAWNPRQIFTQRTVPADGDGENPPKGQGEARKRREVIIINEELEGSFREVEETGAAEGG